MERETARVLHERRTRDAATGIFDDWFYAVQGIELAAGASNLALMSLNLRDGLRLRSGGRIARPAAA